MAKPFRRIVTQHDAAGNSIVASVETLTPKPIATGDADFELVWTTPTVPADLNAGNDGLSDAGITLKGGSVIRIVDLLPGCESPMHRSFSIDYGIFLEGECELELDGGEVVALVPGDIVVQRGTNHLWRNRSDTTTCRVAFVLIEAKPVVIDGKVLEEVHP